MTYAKELRNREIVTMYQQGMTLAEVGKVYGMTRQAVQLILKDRGIPRRPTGRKHLPDTAFAQEEAQK